MGSICFACGTEFHLLISFIIASIEYPGQNKILLLFKNPRIDKYIDRLTNKHVWDEIIIIDPMHSTESITQQIEQISVNITTLHFFSWGFPPFNSLFHLCHQRGAKIILTDEGIGTYMPYKRYTAWLNVQPENNHLIDGFDMAELDEIWLLEPKRYLDSPVVPLKKISLEVFFEYCKSNQKVVEEFNSLFPFPANTQFTYDLIYFRQYLYIYEYYSEFTDAVVDDLTLKILEAYNFCVKNHPAYTNTLYQRDIKNELQINHPWEVFVISTIINTNSNIKLPKIFISPTSSGMFNSCALGIPGVYIFLYKLVERYTDYRDPTIEEFIEHNRRVHPEAALYIPESWEEFSELLKWATAKLQITENENPTNINKYENTKLIQNLIYLWDLVKNQKVILFKKENEIFRLSSSVNDHVQEQQRIENELQQIITSKSTLQDQLQETLAYQSTLESKLQETTAAKATVENQLQEVIVSKENIESKLQEIIAAKTTRENQLQEAIVNKENIERELYETSTRKQDLENQLQQISSSKAWKFVIKLRSIRVAVLPESSPQFKLLRFIWRSIRPRM